MILPAIVVVGYNRPDALKRILVSLSNANYKYDNITLIISLDRSDNSEMVEKCAKEFVWSHGDKIIRTFEERQGLKNHILQCGDLSDKYGAVIILEDDLLVAPDFYNFTVAALDKYKDNPKVTGVGLYSHEWNGYSHVPFQKRMGDSDVFAGQFSITWGQCWSKDHWNRFKKWLSMNEEYTPSEYIPERINRWSKQSWGKFFVRYIVENDLYYIIPNVSLTTNFSEVGEHSKIVNTDHQVALWNTRNRGYAFSAFEELIKYDIFFEPVLNTEQLFGIKEQEVDIDLNNTKKKKLERRYLLTTAIKPFALIKSYGLSIRPIEENIIHSIPGQGIYLYDTSQAAEVIKTGSNYQKLRYDLRGYNFLQLLPMVFLNFNEVLRIKLSLHLKRLMRK